MDNYLSRLAILLLLCTGIIGCYPSAEGPLFQTQSIENNKGIIYIYYPHKLLAGARISIDSQPIGHLKRRGYLYKSIEPGKHTVRCDQDWKPLDGKNFSYLLDVEVSEKKVCWIEVEPLNLLHAEAILALKVVDEEQALPKIENLNLSME